MNVEKESPEHVVKRVQKSPREGTQRRILIGIFILQVVMTQ